MEDIKKLVEKAYTLNEEDTGSYFDYEDMRNCLISLEKLVEEKEKQLQEAQSSDNASNYILGDVSESLQSDIRNKLNPLKNIISMIENGDTECFYQKLFKQEIKQAKISIKYLSNFR